MELDSIGMGAPEDAPMMVEDPVAAAEQEERVLLRQDDDDDEDEHPQQKLPGLATPVDLKYRTCHEQQDTDSGPSEADAVVVVPGGAAASAPTAAAAAAAASAGRDSILAGAYGCSICLELMVDPVVGETHPVGGAEGRGEGCGSRRSVHAICGAESAYCCCCCCGGGRPFLVPASTPRV